MKRTARSAATKKSKKLSSTTKRRTASTGRAVSARRKTTKGKVPFLASLHGKQIMKLAVLAGVVLGLFGGYLQYAQYNPGRTETVEAATLIRDNSSFTCNWGSSSGMLVEGCSPGFSYLGQNGPAGDRTIRSALVDGMSNAPSGVPNERVDAQGGNVPLNSTQWITGWQRVVDVPSNIPEGSGFRWHLMGFWEIHGRQRDQAIIQPELWKQGGQVRYRMNSNAGYNAARYYDIGPVTLNKWEYWEVGVNYRNSGGWIRVYKNGQLVASKDGEITSETGSGYWKAANYRVASLTGKSTVDYSGVRVWDSRPSLPPQVSSGGNVPTPAPPPTPSPTPTPTPSPIPTPTPVPSPGATIDAESEIAGQCFNQRIVSCSTMLKNDTVASLGKAVILFANNNSISHQFQTDNGKYKVGFTMKGENYRGVARIDAYLDGVRIAKDFAVNSTKAYVYHNTNRTFTAGTHTVKIVFVNDKCGNRFPSEKCSPQYDRNVLMDQFRVIKVE